MKIGQARNVAAREDAGTIVHIKDEIGHKAFYTTTDNTEKAVTVKIAGSYSSRARRAQEASRDELFKIRGLPDGDQATQLGLAVLVACIIEWDGFFDEHDNPLPLTPENAFVVLRDMPWIKEQLETTHNNHAAFFRPS